MVGNDIAIGCLFCLIRNPQFKLPLDGANNSYMMCEEACLYLTHEELVPLQGCTGLA